MITLDEGTFIKLLRKPLSEMWVVDYYASWCGPCQKLAIHWKRLSKQVKNNNFVLNRIYDFFSPFS